MKSTIKVLLLFAIAAVGSSLLWADDVTFATQATQGCFGGLSCTPSSTNPVDGGLSFTGTAFGPVTTVGGHTTLTLGSFTLDNTATFLHPAGYAGVFEALITFDMPSGIDGGQTATFTAPFLGAVTYLVGGGVNIDFDCLFCGDHQVFTFNDGSTTGAFSLRLDDVDLDVNGVLSRQGHSDTENLYGEICRADQVSAVPEPSSLIMLGSGLLGAVGVIRRRVSL